MPHNIVPYYYHKDSWTVAFSGNSSKIVMTPSGSVFKDSVAIENLVVDQDGNPGYAGLPAKNEFAIFTNRQDGTGYDAAVHVNIKDVNVTGKQINLATGEVKFNVWRHVSVVLDNVNKTAKIYLDGVLGAEIAYTGDISLFSSIRSSVLGRHAFVKFEGYEYAGLIDDFRIYPTPLTEDQINDIVLWGNQKIEFEERVFVPPKGFHKGKTASFRFSSDDYMNIRQLGIEYRREEIR